VRHYNRAVSKLETAVASVGREIFRAGFTATTVKAAGGKSTLQSEPF
jgi:hypothetical protein